MLKQTKYLGFSLISILVIAFIFAPVSVARAENTELVIEDVSVEWIVNQTESKRALFHVTTNKGSFDFLLAGNASKIESETCIEIDIYVPQDETYVYVQSANTSIPDVLYDAPYVEPGVGVESIHILLSPILATVLRAFAIIVAFAVFIILLIEFIVTLLTGQLQYALNTLLKGIFYASIPWVYVTLYDNDKNEDGSLDLYIPYDVIVQALVDNGQFYLATPFSWWFINRVIINLIFWQITYFVATWVQARIPEAPSPLLPPHASFSWTPDIVAPGQEVTFHSTSYDPDGEIQSWHWWFGDGSEAYGETVTHVYTQSGSYNIRLEVTDDDGLKDETSTSLMGIVFNVIPEAPLGTFSIILAMFSALGVLTVMYRRRELGKETRALG